MKNELLILGLVGAISANAVTFHKADVDFLKQIAPYGITQANWDNAEYASMMNIETHRVSDYAVIYNDKDNAVKFKKSDKKLDINNLSVVDVDGSKLSVYDMLRDRMHNNSMVVLRDGKLVYEHYWSGTNKDTKHTTFSAGKSFTSSLIAIAESEGYLKLSDPVEKYVPEAKGTVIGAYPIQYVADMRSGFALIDDKQNAYGSDWDSSMEDAISWHGDVDTKWVGIKDYTPHLTKLSTKQGSTFEYHSYNTELLGLITSRATGKHWTNYFEDKIWKRVGFASNSTIMVDREKSPITSGALQMTTRDFALMRYIWENDGKNFDGEQIVPKKWLDDVFKGNDEVRSAWLKGKEAPLAKGFYKDQFRVMTLGGKKWLLAVGVQGQIIAVQRESNTVIAMFSNYNVPSSPRMASGFFHQIIPAIDAGIK